MAKRAVLCVLVVMALGGCGSDDSARLNAAMDVDRPLRSFWSQSYAGFDVEDDRLVVYRKSDARLDAFVRERAKDVDVVFRDAPYSLDELEPLVERVEADWPYWRKTWDFRITMVRPRIDGTGVNVFVAADDLEAVRAQFQQRYGDEPIIVDHPPRTGIIPVG